MRIEVNSSFYLRDSNINILNIKVTGGMLRIGNIMVSEEDPSLKCKVKSIVIGSTNFITETFDIVIEKSENDLLKSFENKIFILSEV